MVTERAIMEKMTAAGIIIVFAAIIFQIVENHMLKEKLKVLEQEKLERFPYLIFPPCLNAAYHTAKVNLSEIAKTLYVPIANVSVAEYEN